MVLFVPRPQTRARFPLTSAPSSNGPPPEVLTSSHVSIVLDRENFLAEAMITDAEEDLFHAASDLSALIR